MTQNPQDLLGQLTGMLQHVQQDATQTRAVNQELSQSLTQAVQALTEAVRALTVALQQKRE